MSLLRRLCAFLPLASNTSRHLLKNDKNKEFQRFSHKAPLSDQQQYLIVVVVVVVVVVIVVVVVVVIEEEDDNEKRNNS